MRKNIVAGMLGLMVACAWSPSQALKVTKEGAPDTWFNLRMLMQPYVQLTYTKGAASEITNDIFVRRTRLILAASVNKYVGFFMETESANLGKGRAFDQAFFMQDAIVQFKFSKAFNLNVGMFLPGFSRDFFTSAAALHGADYHGAGTGLAYPALGGTKVWRDSGIQAIGWLMNEKLEYRVSISTGAPNEDSLPRMTGRVSYNVFDAEAKLFPAATYLGAKKVLSLGVAVDMQPDAIATADGAGMYLGVTGDAYWDIPMAHDRRLTGAVGALFYKLGDSNRLGAFFDIGMAFGKWEPMIAIHWAKDKDADFDQSHFDIHAALMHWTMGHNMNIKLDIAAVKGGMTADNPAGIGFFKDGTAIVTTVRTQMLF